MMGQTFEALDDATTIIADRLIDIKEEIAELRRVLQELCYAVNAVASEISDVSSKI